MGCTVLSGRIHAWHELLREPWAEWFENGLSAHFFCNFLLVHAIVRVTNGRREWNQMQISIGFCPRRAVWMNPCINAFIIVFSVYDSGTCFSPAILDITDDDLRAKFMEVGTQTHSAVLHFVRNVLLCETWKNRKTDLTDETMMFESRCVKWW